MQRFDLPAQRMRCPKNCTSEARIPCTGCAWLSEACRHSLACAPLPAPQLTPLTMSSRLGTMHCTAAPGSCSHSSGGARAALNTPHKVALLPCMCWGCALHRQAPQPSIPTFAPACPPTCSRRKSSGVVPSPRSPMSSSQRLQQGGKGQGVGRRGGCTQPHGHGIAGKQHASRLTAPHAYPPRLLYKLPAAGSRQSLSLQF